MQGRTDAPRESLTAAQVEALLTGDMVHYAAGCELLDESNVVIADVSDDLAGGSVEWDNRNAVRGSCRLSFLRSFAWGRDRVRPYLVVSNPTLSARFDLPIFVLARPDDDRADSPQVFQVSGDDLLSLMESGSPAETYVVPSGGTYFAAIQAVVTASGIGAGLMLDSAAQATTIPATRVWALASPTPSYLRILTDLLAEIGYVPPWVDPAGNIRSRPFQPVSERPSEWTLDTRDPATNLVAEDRTVSIETADVANSWRFVQSNATVTPTEGAGIYTPDPNQSEGPNSIDALGREVWKVGWLEAADQAALVASGDKVRADDMASVTTYTLSIDPLPLMGADDVFTFIDVGDPVKIGAASWSLNLDGAPGRLILGGAPPVPVQPVSQQAKATVTAASPLSVVVDGATVPSFANALDATTYGIGDRVTVTIRNPVPPLVLGVES